MSVADVKHQIDQMTADERFYVAAYLQHLANEDDPEYHAEVSKAERRMDAGKKVSLEELTSRHQALKNLGR